MKAHRTAISMLLPAMLLAGALVTQAQSDHEKHHAQSSATDTAAAMASPAKAADSSGMAGGAKGGMAGGGKGGMAGGKKGGMMAEMGDMMKEMGKTPPMALYPTLMQLPDLVPKKRDEIRQASDKWVSEGNALMASGLTKLSDAMQSLNPDMDMNMDMKREATEEIRQGQRLVESGFAAQRALAQNEDPRTMALQWFNRQMNLTPNGQNGETTESGGLSWFHIITMLTLVVFAATMIWMYFQKMKRANALIEKLGGKPDAAIPPPGGVGPDVPPAPAAPPVYSPPAAPAPKIEPGAAPNSDTAPSKPNSFSGTLLVSEIFQETPKVKTFRLTDPAGGKLPFNYLPGQFITVAVTPNGIPLKRSYTIASSPTHRDYCEITVKQEEFGTVSRYLDMEVHVGELLQLTGPSGKFTFTEPDSPSIVLIAGGVGVTPLMSIIRYLTDRSWKGDIYFFTCSKNKASIIFREEIEYLQKRYSNLHVCILLSRQPGQPGEVYIPGRITKEILAERVPEIETRRIHICGPIPMIDAVKQILDELNVPKENIRTESFGTKPATPPVAAPGEADKPPALAPASESVEKPATPPAAPEDGQAAKPPAAPAAPETPTNTAVVTFATSNKTAVLTPEKTVLEASEDIGVNIDYSCRVGTCGVCKIKLLSGNVTMAVEDALTEEDKAQQIILACQAKATAPVSVEA